LMELARLLEGRDLHRPVELVAFSTEEPPFFASPGMGSAVHSPEDTASTLDYRRMAGVVDGVANVVLQAEVAFLESGP